MANKKIKRPSWFKLKAERRALIEKINPDLLQKILLECFDFLETGIMPEFENDIEALAFSVFKPDIDEAWTNYLQRVNARNDTE